jgi:hypothetical protein
MLLACAASLQYTSTMNGVPGMPPEAAGTTAEIFVKLQ